MVMWGRSIPLTTLFFLGKFEQAFNQYLVHILSFVTKWENMTRYWYTQIKLSCNWSRTPYPPCPQKTTTKHYNKSSETYTPRD